MLGTILKLHHSNIFECFSTIHFYLRLHLFLDSEIFFDQSMTISDQSKIALPPLSLLRHVFHISQLLSQRPSNFLRWYSAGRKRLGPPGLPSRCCGLRPQDFGLRSARRAGRQCASTRLRSPEVVENGLSIPPPIPTEFVPEIGEEFGLQGFGSNVRNHFGGAQI